MFDNLEPGWLWMIGGVLLLIAEVIAPGFFLIFVGAAALATGAFTLLFGLGLPAQLTLFAIYALVAVMIGFATIPGTYINVCDGNVSFPFISIELSPALVTFEFSITLTPCFIRCCMIDSEYFSGRS